MSLLKDPEGSEKKHLHKFAGFGGKRVLEIGCGEGRLTWKYAGVSNLTVGLDPDQAALRVARADTPRDLHAMTRFIQASGSNIPFPREAFDIAILAWSL